MNRKMLEVMENVAYEAMEREELIQCMAVALLAEKNLFILGDTGQAKSFVINEFRRRITGTKQFSFLLTKQTDEEKLFGRIDLQSLINGTPKINIAKKIPDSEIVFLDEIFKSNDGVLNSLLTALNERQYTNEGETIDIPVISFFSASNEIPNFSDPAEKILLPLYDRFEFKVVTKYIQNPQNRLAMLKRKQNSDIPVPFVSITLEELRQMQEQVKLVQIPDSINEAMDELLCSLRTRDIPVSDRKYLGYFPLVQAAAWLDGRDVVIISDLLILKNYLWHKPEDISVIEQMLNRLCINPLKNKLEQIENLAEELYLSFMESLRKDELDNSGRNKVKLMLKFRTEILQVYTGFRKLREESVEDSEKALCGKTGAQLEEYSMQASRSVNFTESPLEELWLTNHAA